MSLFDRSVLAFKMIPETTSTALEIKTLFRPLVWAGNSERRMLLNLINTLTKPVNIRENGQRLLSKTDKKELSQSSLIVVLLLFLNCGRLFGWGFVIQNMLSKRNQVYRYFIASLLSKRALTWTCCVEHFNLLLERFLHVWIWAHFIILQLLLETLTYDYSQSAETWLYSPR